MVAPNIDQKESENKVEVRHISDKDKVVLQEVIKEGFPEGPFKDPVRKDKKHSANIPTSLKSSVSKSTVDRLSLSKCCYPESSSTKSTETIRSQGTESDACMSTSRSATCIDSTSQEERTQSNVGGKCDY